jgi:hypothetical protein
MRGFLIVILFALAACAHRPEATPTPQPPVALGNWRLASGKPPTRVEFAALLAACKDRVKAAAEGAIDHCLVNLGLKRTP